MESASRELAFARTASRSQANPPRHNCQRYGVTPRHAWTGARDAQGLSGAARLFGLLLANPAGEGQRPCLTTRERRLRQ